jgi:transketolase
MPAPQQFLEQPEATRDRVLPPGGRRVSIEAAVTYGWHRVVGERGLTIGIDRYDESAPLAPLQDYFGFTPEKLTQRIREWLGR